MGGLYIIWIIMSETYIYQNEEIKESLKFWQ